MILIVQCRKVSLQLARLSGVYFKLLALKSSLYHDAGHGKIETMGALSISALLLVTGGGIAWSSIDTLQAWARYRFIPLH